MICWGLGSVQGSFFGHGFAIETFAISAPGMIGGGWFGKRQAVIEVLGINHLRLRGELFVGGVVERCVFVKNDDFSCGIFADPDGSFLQGIDWRSVWI